MYPPYVLDLLDTAEMQRLARIGQTGVASHAYRSLTSSRFVHSLGAARNGLLIIRHARRNDPVGVVTDEHEALVGAALTAHDIGHDVFSHTLGRLAEQMTNVTHEARAAAILTGEQSLREFIRNAPQDILPFGNRHVVLDELARIPTPHEVLRAHQIDSETAAQMVDGMRWKNAIMRGADRIGKNHFLCEIVSGIIDGDRTDYLQRDSQTAGMTIQFDPSALFPRLGIVEVDGNYHLVVEHSGLPLVAHAFTTRSHLYKTVYNNKLVLKIEAAVYEGMKRFFRSLEGGKADQIAEAMHFLDDGQFSNLVYRECQDPIATKLLLVKDYTRRNKYAIAWDLKGCDVRLGGNGNEGPMNRLLHLLLQIDGPFPEDHIRDEILARANEGETHKLEDHEIIAYFPKFRRVFSRDELLDAFNLYVYERGSPATAYRASDRLRDGKTIDEDLRQAFDAFCLPQTSRYLVVLAPAEHAKRVGRAAEAYMREVLEK